MVFKVQFNLFVFVENAFFISKNIPKELLVEFQIGIESYRFWM